MTERETRTYYVDDVEDLEKAYWMLHGKVYAFGHVVKAIQMLISEASERLFEGGLSDHDREKVEFLLKALYAAEEDMATAIQFDPFAAPREDDTFDQGLHAAYRKALKEGAL